MAKRKPSGAYSGIVGGIVLCEMGGKEVIRTRSHTRKDTSPLVGNCRTDFALVMQLIRKTKKITDTGFRDCHPVRSAYHSALSVNINNYRAAEGAGDRLNLSWYQLSAGKLSNATTVNASIISEGRLEITWQGTEPGHPSHKNDVATAVVYLPASNKFITGPQDIPRSAGRLVINNSQLTTGQPLTVFLFFTVIPMNYRNKSESNVSDSKSLVVSSE